MTTKTYWFKIEGTIYADDYHDAHEQVEAMAVAGVNCERVFREVKEVKE